MVTRRSDTTFGSIANYSCDEGFVLNPDDDTSRMRVCQADGTWFGPDPTCDSMLSQGLAGLLVWFVILAYLFYFKYT